MKQIQSKLTEKDPIISYHSGGRTWPHGAEEGSGGAGWCASSSLTSPPAPSGPAASTGSPRKRQSPPEQEVKNSSKIA
jgi:hypothetical protein